MSQIIPEYNLKELIFDISKLYRADNGSTKKYEIDIKVPFIDEQEGYIPKSNLVGKIKLIKADNTIEALLEDTHITAQANCDKCLKKFSIPIHINAAERSFYLNEEDAEHEDDMLIDRKKLLLDANELVRQEIILHFPIVLVCSEGCKGVPGYQTDDKNKPKNPLADLKNMWKSN